MITQEEKRRQKQRYSKQWRKDREKEIRQYNKQYRETHREQTIATNKQYYKANKERIHKRNYKWIETGFRSILTTRIANARLYDKKKNRENNIDIEYILDLLKLQDECCAVTGVKMSHNFRDLKAVSIDRIDSTKGHIKGNIQLVCLFYNLGKKDYPDSEARALIQEIEMNLLKKLKAQGYLNLNQEN